MTVLILILTHTIGFATGVLAYKNNPEKFDKIIGKLDKFHDKVEAKIGKKR